MAKVKLWFFQQGTRVPGEEHNLADPAGCELLPQTQCESPELR